MALTSSTTTGPGSRTVWNYRLGEESIRPRVPRSPGSPGANQTQSVSFSGHDWSSSNVGDESGALPGAYQLADDMYLALPPGPSQSVNLTHGPVLWEESFELGSPQTRRNLTRTPSKTKKTISGWVNTSSHTNSPTQQPPMDSPNRTNSGRSARARSAPGVQRKDSTPNYPVIPPPASHDASRNTSSVNVTGATAQTAGSASSPKNTTQNTSVFRLHSQSQSSPHVYSRSHSRILVRDMPATTGCSVTTLAKKKPQRSADNIDLWPIVRMAKSTNMEEQKQAASVSAAICLNPENHLSIIHAGLVAPLIALVGSPDPFIRRDACQAVAYLAAENSSQIIIAENGGIPALVYLLNYPFESEVRTHATEAIYNLVLNEGQGETIMDADGAEALIKLIKSRFSECRKAAIKTIVALCSSEETAHKISARKILAEFPILLNSKDDFTKNELCKALAHMMKIGDYVSHAKSFSLEYSIMGVLVYCLKNKKDDSMLLSALDAMAQFSSEGEAILAFLSHNIHDCLVKTLRHKSYDVQKETLRIMSLMTCTSDYSHVLVEDSETFSIIIGLASTNNTQVVKSISRIFSHIAKAGYIRRMIDYNAVESIISMASSTDYEIQLDMGITLGNILLMHDVHIESRADEYSKLSEQGAFDVLVALSELRDNFVQRVLSSGITSMLETCSPNSSLYSTIVVSFIKLGVNESHTVIANIVHGLFLLSNLPGCTKTLSESGGLNYLRKVCLNKEIDTSIIDEAKLAIDNIVRNTRRHA